MKTIIDKNIKIKTFLEMGKKNEVQIIDIREKYERDSLESCAYQAAQRSKLI